MTRQRKTTTQRGYGHAHQQRRKQLLPLALGRPCPMCGAPMLHADTLDLDHGQPLALGGDGGSSRIVHSVCNRRRGQALGEELKRRRRQMATSPTPVRFPPAPVKRAQSRQW